MKKEDFAGYAEHDYHPIIREKSLALLIKLLQEHKPNKLLEIGTFIGYSASKMLEACPNAKLTTLEKDPQNAAYAKQNLSCFAERVEVICCDAFDFLQNSNETFDFIFLDGPKGQYIKYYPHLKRLLKSGGVLVADDILFYGLVSSGEKVEHKHRSIVNNLRKFLEVLQNDSDFETKIYDFDDGMSVSIKK